MKTNSKLITRLLCLVLTVITVLTLAACPAGAPTVTTGSSAGSTTGNKPSGGHPDDVTDPVYGNGGEVKGAGAALAEDAFALTPHTPDEANAQEMTATQFINVFRRTGPEEGKTYKITDGNPVMFTGSNRTYDGKGAILISPAGIVIDGASEATLTGLTVIGPILVKSCENFTLNNVEANNPSATALTVEKEAHALSVTGARLVGKTAVSNAANGTLITESVMLHTEAGVADTAEKGAAVIGCILEGSGTGIATASTGAYIRGNTLDLTEADTGVSLANGSLNGLVALNVIRGAQKAISLKGVTNTSVILNSCVTVTAEDCVSIYVCDNSLGGRLRLKNINYLLADGNSYPEADGLEHLPLVSGNENINGDDLTDVDARLDVGANEELLPHNNKDLFLEMERMNSVSIGCMDIGLEAGDYLLEKSVKDDYVILAPGVYSVTHHIIFNAGHSNTTVYGYGAYMERAKSSEQNLGRHIQISYVTDLVFKGLTIGYERQSCGQVYVLAKLKDSTLLVVTGAGMDNEFGNTDTNYYNVTGMGAQRMNTFYAYCDTSFSSIVKQSDGLMKMRVDASVYEMIEKGDILTCRSAQGDTTVPIDNSRGIYFKDFTNYGCSGSYAFVENSNRTATTYYRVANITKNGPIIDQQTYEDYKVLEDEYGVNLEVSIDELGRYRGSLPHIGSIDATHTAGCAQGSVAISCIFENMCDDATNQRHNHARVDEFIDNGDGTTTIVYKGNYPRLHWDNGTGGAGIVCRSFIKGDRVFIYTGTGQLVCDTEALSATEEYKIPDGNGGYMTKRVNNDEREARMRALGGTESCLMTFRCVTVATEAINPDAYAGIDLTRNDCEDAPKVLIDNMSMASNGFFFDNCRMQNIRSRGLLIKASGGTIQHCTFRNIGMACAAINYEIFWGESGVSENVTVKNNLMDHTGYFSKYNRSNMNRYSPVSIEGLGSRVDEDFLLYKNIVIDGNVFRNRTTTYGIYVNSARDVVITNNDFGNHVDGESEENPTLAVHINGAMNIKIEGNTYSSLDLPIEEKIIAEHNKNVYGADVEHNGEPIIPDRE